MRNGDAGHSEGAVATLSRGVQTAPELTHGAGVTIGLSLVGAAGRIVVPVLIQQAIDGGITDDGVDVERVAMLCVIGLVVAYL